MTHTLTDGPPPPAALWPTAGAGILGDVATATRTRADIARTVPDAPAMAPAPESPWTRVETDRAALLGLALPDPPTRRTRRRVRWWQLAPKG